MTQNEHGGVQQLQPQRHIEEVFQPQVVVPKTTFAPGILFDRKRLPLTILVALVALALVRLGFWQLDRRDQRMARNREIQQRLEQPPVQLTGAIENPQELAYRYATVAGAFDYDNEMLVQSRGPNGKPGFRVLTPLRITGSDSAVLIDRGWIPHPESSPEKRGAFRGAQTAEVRGLAQIPTVRTTGAAPVMAQSTTDGDRIDAWFWVDIPRMQQQLAYPLLPVYLEQSPDPGAPELPVRGENIVWQNAMQNLGYAFQWFSFAVMLLGGYVAVVGRRPKAPEEST